MAHRAAREVVEAWAKKVAGCSTCSGPGRYPAGSQAMMEEVVG